MTAPRSFLDDDVDDEFTEVFDAVIPRVDLVGKSANGARFLLAKSGRPLMSASTVRAMIKAASKPTVVAVYDANGRVIGTANQDDIVPLGELTRPGDKPPKQKLPDGRPVNPPKDLEPAPPAEVGTPADAVVKAVRRRGHWAGLTDVVEQKIAARAVDRVVKAVARGDAPAAVAWVRAQSAAVAAREIRDHRARRRH
ncbi:MAG TPA: hypothetical protein VGL39_07640 [Jatrophihabitantaceae bacterium]|jgi:hypothetical protein